MPSYGIHSTSRDYKRENYEGLKIKLEGKVIKNPKVVSGISAIVAPHLGNELPEWVLLERFSPGKGYKARIVMSDARELVGVCTSDSVEEALRGAILAAASSGQRQRMS